MGLGNLGTACAKSLDALGFNVSGWARQKHSIDGIRCFAGDADLPHFLSTIDILVCLLPLTPATKNILCRSLFRQLRTGASIINVGRGAHLVEEDLLDALENGQLSFATLSLIHI